MSFYVVNSDSYYFNSESWKNERVYLESRGCKLLNRHQTNDFEFYKFFTKKEGELKPVLTQEYKYYVLPYEPDDLMKDGLLTDRVLIDLINDNLASDIFMASTNCNECCVVHCNLLDEDILYILSSGHLNTPFIAFNKNSNFFVLIDFDLPCQIIGYKDNINDKNQYIKREVGNEGWSTVFSRYSNYSNMPNLFKEYYSFLLPKAVTLELNVMK